MDGNVLVVTVGLPRSGKTTWARKQGTPIVNPDSIRLALHGQRYIQLAEPIVWAIAKIMVRALFLAGHRSVILDSTNTTRKRRDEWVSDQWTTLFKPISTSRRECLRRSKEEKDTEIMPIIDKMDEQFEALERDEKVLLEF